jgi:hypothetical protein
LFSANSQVSEKEKVTIRVLSVKRSGDGCKAEVTSTRVRYEIATDISSSCAMLRAGEYYKAVRGVQENQPSDETKDSASLVIFNNADNKRRPGAVFDIESETAVALKPCPKDDPLGINSAEPCQPLPPKRQPR